MFSAVALMVANYGGGIFIDLFGATSVIRHSGSSYLAIFWWAAAFSFLLPWYAFAPSIAAGCSMAARKTIIRPVEIDYMAPLDCAGRSTKQGLRRTNDFSKHVP